MNVDKVKKLINLNKYKIDLQKLDYDKVYGQFLSPFKMYYDVIEVNCGIWASPPMPVGYIQKMAGKMYIEPVDMILSRPVNIGEKIPVIETSKMYLYDCFVGTIHIDNEQAVTQYTIHISYVKVKQ